MSWELILTILLTLGFGIATIVLALKLNKKKQPVWAYTTDKIIGLGTNPPPELQVTFSGTPVNNVYQTTFIFFNNGNEAIRQDDITEKITLHIKEAKILREPVIIAKSSDAIKPSARLLQKDNENRVELDFLYLDHKDGALVEIMHTETEDITCSANIIGMKKLKNIGKFKLRSRRLSSIAMSVCLLFAIMFIVYFVTTLMPGLNTNWQSYLDEHTVIDNLISIAVPLLGGGSIGILIATLPEYFSTRKFPNWSLIEK